MSWFSFRFKSKFKIDVARIHDEIYRDIFIDEQQIQSWMSNFQNSNSNAMLHPYVEIAQTYTNAGLQEKASNFYQRFLNIQLDKRIHGLYLQNLLLAQTSTNQSILDAHKKWANVYDDPRRRKHWERRFDKHPKTKLKIGYTCHFFSNSVAQNFLLPFLKCHDPNKFETYCYDDEGVDSSLHHYADHWRDIRGISDKDLASMIMADGIDVLQELNGFCITNRFDALSYRPAPVQINWYNHNATTGLPYIDYVMSDRFSIRDADLPYFVEQAYRTEYFIAAVYCDPEKFGSIAEAAPCIKNGYITFGYFGGSHKITLSAIAAWTAVLNQVPNSRLYLKCGSFSHNLYRKIFLQHFINAGIDVKRIQFEGWTDQRTTLSRYSEVDIMLDNIPMSGGSTMVEAVIQGVPTITLAGERWAARSGASVMRTLRHPELIADTLEDYINMAVQLARDVPRINHYRYALRAGMEDSSLTDIKGCYPNFEKGYFEMWDNWCGTSA